MTEILNRYSDNPDLQSSDHDGRFRVGEVDIIPGFSVQTDEDFRSLHSALSYYGDISVTTDSAVVRIELEDTSLRPEEIPEFYETAQDALRELAGAAITRVQQE